MNVWGKSLRMRYHSDIDRCRQELETLREENSNKAAFRYKEVQQKLTHVGLGGIFLETTI